MSYTMAEALNAALHDAMAEDEQVVVLGEDVATLGGVFRITVDLQRKFGDKRIFDTPLAESGIVGTAIGMAMYGMRPVVEIQFDGFLYPAFEQLVCHVAKLRNRTMGALQLPMVIRIPYGGGIGAVEHHSESPESYFMHTAGLKVFTPGTPQDAYSMLREAIADPDPVVFMEPKRSYRAFKEEVPEEEEVMEIGKASIVKEGDRLTLIGWGAMMRTILPAVEKVEKERGVLIEVIDLLTMAPLDGATLVESVKKTGRCVIVQEAPKSLGMASEIIARWVIL